MEREREKVDRWDPGILMPDRYGRATCSTELRLRGGILGNARHGNWRPADSSEIPKRTRLSQDARNGDGDTSSGSSASETSTSPFLKEEVGIIDLIEDAIDKDATEGFSWSLSSAYRWV